MTTSLIKDPDFYMLQLPISCKIVSHTTKLIGNKVISLYIVCIVIYNTSEEFIIYDNDPRYKLIDDYLGNKNIFKENIK